MTNLNDTPSRGKVLAAELNSFSYEPYVIQHMDCREGFFVVDTAGAYSLDTGKRLARARFWWPVAVRRVLGVAAVVAASMFAAYILWSAA